MSLTLILFSYPTHLLNWVPQILNTTLGCLQLITGVVLCVLIIFLVSALFSVNPDAMKIDNILNPKLDSGTKPKTHSYLTILNLVFEKIPGSRDFIVYDTNDLGATNLALLFAGRNYTFTYRDGKRYIIVTQPSNLHYDHAAGAVVAVRLLAKSRILNELESRDFIINSCNQPIDKSVSSNGSLITMMVKKHS